MSLTKNIVDLSQSAVVYNGTTIKSIDVPEKFINAIPSPLPNKKFLSEDDIVSLICDVIVNKSNGVTPRSKIDDPSLGVVEIYKEVFVCQNQAGLIDFFVQIRRGHLTVEKIEYSVKGVIE